MRNATYADGKGGAAPAVIGRELQRGALRKRAGRGAAAPESLTGCVSEISSCAGHEHSYADALKDYAAVYEAYQSYLTPGDAVVHDYDQLAAVAAEEHHLGCLNDDLLASTLIPDDVSDEEIESCGYLGWLHHC